MRHARSNLALLGLCFATCILPGPVDAAAPASPRATPPGNTAQSRQQPAAPAESNPLIKESLPEATDAVSLTPDAVDRLRRQVLAQCGLPESAGGNLPWYFHFEFGRALLADGDAGRAVAELSRAVNLNPYPHAGKRMYGMWYIDYFPYYQLALAHSALGNWTCAANAMRLSRLAEAGGPDHFDVVRYADLQRQIEGKAPYTEACKASDE